MLSSSEALKELMEIPSVKSPKLALSRYDLFVEKELHENPRGEMPRGIYQDDLALLSRHIHINLTHATHLLHG